MPKTVVAAQRWKRILKMIAARYARPYPQGAFMFPVIGLSFAMTQVKLSRRTAA
jgi:hypothetical protein